MMLTPTALRNPDHDGVGHKAQHRTEPEESRCEHDDAGEHRECEQGTRWITGVMDRWDVGHDHGHRARALDSHERRAGEQRAGDRPDHVRVQARERVDPGEEPRGEAVGDTLHAKHQARDGILPQRVSPDREAELHLEARMRWPSRPGSSARTAPTTVATTMMNAQADSQLKSVNATPRSPYCCWLLATRVGR
jgi:hypothetical protein